MNVCCSNGYEFGRKQISIVFCSLLSFLILRINFSCFKYLAFIQQQFRMNLLNQWIKCSFHSSAFTLEKIEPMNTNFSELSSIPLRPIDKRMFVWSGKYKRIEDVPDRSSRATISRVHNICRLKVCNYMVLGSIIGCIIYIISGKKDAAKGITLSKISETRHEEYKKAIEERMIKS